MRIAAWSWTRFILYPRFAALSWILAGGSAAAASFTTLSTFNGTNGAKPMAGLVVGTNGNFYGTTSGGGANGQGTVVQLSVAGAGGATITTLLEFNGTNGAKPFDTLLQATDGNLYGTASAGGSSNNGTVFGMTLNGRLLFVASFDGTNNGARPAAGLVQGSDGNFYGTASVGGASNKGTIFAVTPSGLLSAVAAFNGTNGAGPIGRLVAGSAQSNLLYGTTSAGGTNNAGTIFSLRVGTNPVLTSLYSFTGGADGASPQAGLTLGTNGTLYGTTAGGGAGGQGTVFQFKPGGAPSSLASFFGTNGAGPFAPVTQANDANLYGTTFSGGANNGGTVFCLTPDGKTFTNLYFFHGGRDGATPYYAGVVQGSDGNLYGTTSSGGSGGRGTVFRIGGFGPFIISTPSGQTVVSGSTVTFNVSAGGSVPLNFHWLLNSNQLADNGRISGTATSMLTISNVTVADAGSYQVFVRNGAGTVLSTGAVLAVVSPPTLRITGPSANTLMSNSMLTFSGSTTDNVAVAGVYYQWNGTGWQLAPPQNGWARWSVDGLSLMPGTNTFEAYAINVVGLFSPTNSLTFIGPVTVNISGMGTVSPNYNGQWLKAGRSFALNAKPGPGFLLANWMDAGGVVLTNGATLRFTMQTNLMVVANFAPNPFLPVSGSYSGLFYDTNGVTQTSSGAFRLTVATKGGYSGYLQIGNQRLALTGKFELDGSAMSTAKSGHNLSPLTVWLQLDLANVTGQVVGSVSNAAWTASLLGDRAVFNSRSNAWPLARRYTLSLPGDSQSEVSPIGDGYGMVSITPSGQLSLMGSVADGAKFSQGVQVSMTTLSTNVQWPLYVPLYKGQGSLLGWITISNQGLDGAVTWIKPASAGGGFYTNGFNLSLVSLGSRYDPPQGAGNVLSLTNAQLALSGGNLDSAFTNDVAFGTGSQVTNSSASEPKLNLRFTLATGLFRGSIVPPGRTQPVSLNGVALQDQDLGSGYFLDATLSGQVRLEP